MRLLFVFIVQLAYSANSFSYDNRFEMYNQYTLNKIYCHYTKSIKNSLENYGFIPNSINTLNGNVTYDADVVQPRFLQILNNLILLSNQQNVYNKQCSVDDVIELEKSSFKSFSANFKDIYPHLRHINMSPANEFDRNIYELGDWMGISLVNSSVINNKNLKSYTKIQAERLYKYLSHSAAGLYTYDFKPKNNRFEVGHLTLAIDSLSLYSYITNNSKYVDLAVNLIDKLSRQMIEEDESGTQYTHLATYGEIFESLSLARYVQKNTYDKDELFEKLYFQMKDRFSDNDRLKYTLDKDKICYHALAFEGAFYRPLLYFHYNNNKREVAFINKQVSVFEKALGVPPVVGKCTNDKSFLALNHGALGVYYMYIKLKRIQSILGYDERAESKIKKVLSVFNTLHSSKYYAREYSDNEGYVTKDMGGNVWFFNEGVVPLLYSYANPESLVGKTGSFQGCNYYYMPGFKKIN